jgi:hypothetical protein
MNLGAISNNKSHSKATGPADPGGFDNGLEYLHAVQDVVG